MDTELAKIEKARSGDRAAFDDLVRLYDQKVYNLALRLCNDTDDAFDVAQEAFWRLYRTIGQYEGECSFSSWVYRLTVNAAMDHHRRRKRDRRFRVYDGDAALAQLPDTRYDPVASYNQTALREAIFSALAQLAPDYRTVFVLRELYGRSYAEIAEIVDCEEGTVKSRLFRAREKLRALLTKSGNFPGR